MARSHCRPGVRLDREDAVITSARTSQEAFVITAPSRSRPRLARPARRAGWHPAFAIEGPW